MEKEVGFLKRAYQGYRKVLLKRHAVWLMLSIILAFAFIFSSSFVYARALTCADNPINLWHFDENTGIVVNDACGTKNGTINDANWINGKYNYSLNFDGINDFVSVGNSISKPTSISFWFDYDTIGISEGLIQYGWNSGDYKLFGTVWTTTGGNQLLLLIRTSPSDFRYYRIAYESNLSSGWNNVIISWEGTTKKAYLNGVEQNLILISQAGSEPNSNDLLNTDVLEIGRAEAGGFYYYDGALDEIALFNRSLTLSEVQQMYFDCTPNWIANYTSCGTNLNASCGTYDNKTKIYYDSNSCGTSLTLPADNGTCIACDYCSPSWYCETLNTTCFNEWRECLAIGDNNYGICCAVTHLGNDCNFTGDLGQYKQPCGDMVTTFTTNADYPYVDCNTTATFGLAITINNTRQDFKHLFMEFPTIPYTFNWTWDNATQSYSINLLFTTEGDYPYVIWSDYPLGAMQNITGTLKVRCSCYITVNGYTLFPTNATEPYKNTHAYIGMELTSQKKTGMTGSRNPYDTQLEDFLTPLTFSKYPYKMFHAPYVNGQAVVKLWEKNETYAIRLFDGDVTFQQGVYSTVNATRLYKTNIFLGTQKFTCGTGGDEQFNYFFTQKELQPFTWLFNWIFLILIIAVIVIAGFLLFMIPPFAMPFGIGGVVLLCILRIVLWVAIG